MEPQLVILLNIVIATALAGTIGLEREMKGKPAGLRTNMIVAGASCLLVSLTTPLIDFVIGHESVEIIRADPIRIIQALVVGIGFIGGGTILKLTGSEKIHGLTTAATLLYSAGIGISVALKQYILSVGITLLIFTINYSLDRLRDKIKK